MIEIPLAHDKVALIDDADADIVLGFTWSLVKGKNGIFYAVARPVIGGKRIYLLMHRLLIRDVKLIDHQDGNGLNNQRNNLRPASSGQNRANSRKRKSGLSRFKGVTRNQIYGRWIAQISFGSRRRYLGSFDTEEQAARAYDLAARNFHGEFAWVNFPTVAKPQKEGK